MSDVQQFMQSLTGQSSQEVRARIHELESELIRHPQVAIETRHYFADGMYAREALIKAGTLCTGKIHRHEHLCVVSMGKIAIATEDGSKIIEAPLTFISRPGTKRVGYALEDTVWTTFHLNTDNESDLEIIESRLEAPDYASAVPGLNRPVVTTHQKGLERLPA